MKGGNIMKRTIKFRTDCASIGFGQYLKVSDSKYYLMINAIAHKHNVAVSNIKIYDWLKDKYSKVTIKYSDITDYQNFVIDFLEYFNRYIKDVKMKM